MHIENKGEDVVGSFSKESLVKKKTIKKKLSSKRFTRLLSLKKIPLPAHLRFLNLFLNPAASQTSRQLDVGCLKRYTIHALNIVYGNQNTHAYRGVVAQWVERRPRDAMDSMTSGSNPVWSTRHNYESFSLSTYCV